MNYIHRDEHGIMKNKVSARLANKLMNESKGEFRPYKYKKNDDTITLTAFVFADDFSLIISRDVTMYFWQGDKLIPEE